MAVKPIPDGYHTVIPYLSVKGAADALEFYKQAFGATEVYRLAMPNGGIGHAEIKVGDSQIMLADPCEDTDFRSPDALSGTTLGIHLYVEDVDARFAQAVASGATVVKPLADQFYGDRNSTLQDPFGHVWFLSSHAEDVSPEEISRRAEALFATMGGAE